MSRQPFRRRLKNAHSDSECAFLGGHPSALVADDLPTRRRNQESGPTTKQPWDRQTKQKYINFGDANPSRNSSTLGRPTQAETIQPWSRQPRWHESTGIDNQQNRHIIIPNETISTMKTLVCSTRGNRFTGSPGLCGTTRVHSVEHQNRESATKSSHRARRVHQREISPTTSS